MIAPVPPTRFVGINEGRAAWAAEAFEYLTTRASSYGSYVFYSDLADEIQSRAGLWTKASARNWIGRILFDVAHRCQDEGVPHLTSLVVHKHDGQVGSGYDEVLKVQGLEPLGDQLERETHAAETRLECYRHWGADVPASAKPHLTREFEQIVKRARSRRETQRGSVCPSCFVEMPIHGSCPNCS